MSDPIMDTFFRGGTDSAASDDPIMETYNRAGLSVADGARNRLAAQGLTPEQVKNTEAGVVPPGPSMMQEFANDPLRGTGDAAMGALKGAGQMVAGAMPLDANPGAGMLQGVEMARRMGQAQIDYAGDPVRRGIMTGLNAIPIVGAPVADLLQPSMVAANREPTPEERQGAAGSAVQLGTMVGGPAALKDTLGRGTGITERAAGQYQRGISTPETAQLTESMARPMLKARIKVSGSVADAERAGVASQDAALGASATSAILEAMPKPRATMGPGGLSLDAGQTAVAGSRANLAARNAALVNDATFQGNVQTITQALADSGAKTPRNILIEGAKDIGKKSFYGEIASKVVGVPPGFVAAVVTAVKGAGILRDLMKTPYWQTATAIAKSKFGEALKTGDLATAGEIGAGIASGALAADAFGHRDAIQKLSAEVSQYATPELRRLAVGTKRYTYTEPDGKVIAIPPNVVSGFVGARNLTETNSPISLWLDAMKKQGRIKDGGKIDAQ